MSHCLEYLIPRHDLRGGKALRLIQDMDSASRQQAQALRKGGVPREVALEARHGHDRHPTAQVLAEHADGERVADAEGPLVEGVEGGGHDRDDVRLRERVGLARQLVIDPHRMAGEPRELWDIDESRPLRGDDHADVPPAGLGQRHQFVNSAGRGRGARDDAPHTLGGRCLAWPDAPWLMVALRDPGWLTRACARYDDHGMQRAGKRWNMWRSLPGAGVLVVRDCRVLMVLHERGGIFRWELPSGVVDPGESFEETAARETVEETGIAVAVGALLCTAVMDVAKAKYRGINAYFRAEALDDAIPYTSPRKERISAASYIDLAQLSPRKIHPVDRRILSMWRRKPDRPAYYVYISL